MIFTIQLQKFDFFAWESNEMKYSWNLGSGENWDPLSIPARHGRSQSNYGTVQQQQQLNIFCSLPDGIKHLRSLKPLPPWIVTRVSTLKY
nr:hypothetical protein CFP56_27462 [Quercus suber]